VGTYHIGRGRRRPLIEFDWRWRNDKIGETPCRGSRHENARNGKSQADHFFTFSPNLDQAADGFGSKRGRRYVRRVEAFTKALTIMTDSGRCDHTATAFCRVIAARSTDESRSFHRSFWSEGDIEVAMGTVKWFNATKGYGFIKPDGQGPDVFVHISAVEKAGYTGLADGAKISYELVTTRNGKAAAENLRVG
jgi:CspA family cold shock protein